jgi:hypothetical protein
MGMPSAKSQKRIKNDAQAKNAQAGVWRVESATGLYLKVSETGSRSWFWRYRVGKKRREMGLGSLGHLSLAGAREKARELAVERDKGHDPIESRRQKKAENLAKAQAEARAAKRVTFSQAAEAYLKAHEASWKHRYARACDGTR